jgi:hypothetical protein
VPIVSISKIQHRFGLNENLPQLSAAELGWALDTRRLFIGNGPISEGAPTIGNTEILTEHSDLLAISNSYEYLGQAAGYTHQTGIAIGTPTTRTLQSKLDDFVSVKDFGAQGDGIADDTAAINRAFFQLFATPNQNEQIRRSLFFPAGVYLVSDTIKIPTYAKVYGEGKNSSIIRQTASSTVVALADSAQQIGLDIGLSAATIPSFIEINDISFENTQEGDVANVTNSRNCTFRRVGFRGSKTVAPSVVGTNFPSCVKLFSTPVNQTRNIVFEQCDFVNNNFGIIADDDMQNILIDSGVFENLYKGVKMGENTSGSGSSVFGPRGVKITNSYFNHVYNVGIHIYSISKIVSAYNYFADVGNSLVGLGNPTSDVIIFEASGNYSIADIFERPDSDIGLYQRVNQNGYKVYYLDSADGVYYGYHKAEAGLRIQLNNNVATPTTTGISFSSINDLTVAIYYTAIRGNNVRHGTMRLTASNTGSTLTDDFNDDGADIGLTFSLAVAADIATLRYTTTDAVNPVSFKYRIERLV